MARQALEVTLSDPRSLRVHACVCTCVHMCVCMLARVYRTGVGRGCKCDCVKHAFAHSGRDVGVCLCTVMYSRKSLWAKCPWAWGPSPGRCSQGSVGAGTHSGPGPQPRPSWRRRAG